MKYSRKAAGALSAILIIKQSFGNGVFASDPIELYARMDIADVAVIVAEEEITWEETNMPPAARSDYTRLKQSFSDSFGDEKSKPKMIY